jgi:polyhydroxyalkanoate synthesis regulator phasin
MAAPGNEVRELAERLVLAAFGALALGADRAEKLAEELSEVGAVRKDDARAAVEELAGRWRGDAVRISEKTRVSLAGLFRELGLVTRDDLDELELRVAQLEHRLRLVEGAASPDPLRPPTAPARATPPRRAT